MGIDPKFNPDNAVPVEDEFDPSNAVPVEDEPVQKSIPYNKDLDRRMPFVVGAKVPERPDESVYPKLSDNIPTLVEGMLSHFTPSIIELGKKFNQDPVKGLGELMSTLKDLASPYASQGAMDKLSAKGVNAADAVKGVNAGIEAISAPFTAGMEVTKSIPVIGKPLAHVIELPFQATGEAIAYGTQGIQKTLDVLGVPKDWQNLGMDDKLAGDISSEMNKLNQGLGAFALGGALHLGKAKTLNYIDTPTGKIATQVKRPVKITEPVPVGEQNTIPRKYGFESGAEFLDTPEPKPFTGPGPVDPKIVTAHPQAAYQYRLIQEQLMDAVKRGKDVDLSKILTKETFDKISGTPFEDILQKSVEWSKKYNDFNRKLKENEVTSPANQITPKSKTAKVETPEPVQTIPPSFRREMEHSLGPDKLTGNGKVKDLSDSDLQREYNKQFPEEKNRTVLANIRGNELTHDGARKRLQDYEAGIELGKSDNDTGLLGEMQFVREELQSFIAKETGKPYREMSLEEVKTEIGNIVNRDKGSDSFEKPLSKESKQVVDSESIPDDIKVKSKQNSVPYVDGSDGKTYYGDEAHYQAPLPEGVEPVASGWVVDGVKKSFPTVIDLQMQAAAKAEMKKLADKEGKKLNPENPDDVVMGMDFGITKLAEALYNKGKDMFENKDEVGRLLGGQLKSRANYTIAYNTAKASYLAQINEKFRGVRWAGVTTELNVNARQSQITDIVHDFNRLKDDVRKKAVETRLLENEHEGVFTDVEMAGLAVTASGNTIPLNLTPEQISAVHSLRKAQEITSNLRRDEMLYKNNEALTKTTDQLTEVFRQLSTPGLTGAQINKLVQQAAKLNTAIGDYRNTGREITNYYQSLHDRGYASLKRQGNWAVYAEDPNFPAGSTDGRYYEQFPTVEAAAKKAADLRAQGFNQVESSEVRNFIYDFGNRLTPHELDNLIHQAGVNPSDPAIAKIRSEVYDNYPTTSYQIKRDYIKGYGTTPEDFVKRLVRQMEAFSGAHYRTVAKSEMQKAYNAADFSVEDFRLQNFVNKYMKDAVSATPNTGLKRLGGMARQATYVTQLGLQVMQLYNNAITQPITQNWSYFARPEFGLKGFEPEAYFGRAAKLTADGLRGKATPDFQAFLQRLKIEDVARQAFTKSLVEAEVKNVSKLMNFVSIFDQMGEKVTRTHAAAEAYLVGRDKLGLQGEELHRFAVDAIDNTQTRINRSEQPGWVRSNELMRHAYQFQSFNQLWIENLILAVRSDVIGKSFASSSRHVAGLAIVAGMTGLPLAGVARMLYKGITGKDPQNELEHAVKNDYLESLALYGAPGVLGGDLGPGIAYRSGIMNSVPYGFGYGLEDIPIVGTGITTWKGVEELIKRKGNKLQGLEDITPIKGLKGIPRIIRYNKEGIKSRSGETLVPKSQIGPAEQISGATGVQTKEMLDKRQDKQMRRIKRF